MLLTVSSDDRLSLEDQYVMVLPCELDCASFTVEETEYVCRKGPSCSCSTILETGAQCIAESGPKRAAASG